MMYDLTFILRNISTYGEFNRNKETYQAHSFLRKALCSFRKLAANLHPRKSYQLCKQFTGNCLTL